MIRWFQEHAPIRQKLAIAFGAQAALVFVCLAGSLLAPVSERLIAATAFVMSAALGFLCWRLVTEPYVTTVVRMEGLAAGDLTSPIAYQHYTDCVGRMTQAMHQFRQTTLDKFASGAAAEAARQEAARQIAAEAQASAQQVAAVVSAIGQGLEQLAANSPTASRKSCRGPMPSSKPI
jgi:methyl-accepting chemotaxis protein